MSNSPEKFWSRAKTLLKKGLDWSVDVISKYININVPDFIKKRPILGFVFVLVVLCGIVLIKTPAGPWCWSFVKSEILSKTITAPSDKLSIYVAHLEGDDKQGTIRDRVIDSIKEELGKDLIYVFPEGKPIHLPESSAEDEVIAGKIAEEARLLLQKSGGNLFIWGRVQTVNSNTTLKLHVVDPDGAVTGRLGSSFSFTEENLLSPKFSSAMKDAFMALISSLAAPAFFEGRADLREKMKDIVTRLEPLRNNMGERFNADERGRILFLYAFLEAALAQYEAEPTRLEEAVEAYREALQEYTQDRVPLDWAMTQKNLGDALWELGRREDGTARLEEAIEAYREALQEYTQDRVPLDWAMTQKNLGDALYELWSREGGTEKFKEAKAAYEAAFTVFIKEDSSFYFDGTTENLAIVNNLIAERTKK